MGQWFWSNRILYPTLTLIRAQLEFRVWQKCKIVVTDNICRPGHGAPTGDIRKKKFTEHQINKERGIQKSHSTFSLDNSADFVPSYAPPAKYSSELDLQEGVRFLS